MGNWGDCLTIERRTPEIGYILDDFSAQKLTYVWMKFDSN